MSELRHPLISLCMIVKNEEKNIVRCLKSVTNYVDEILVLDTGSTDQTPQLARELGAQVSLGPWEDNFGKARNLSKKNARGDWILFLDADEELPPETGRTLHYLAQQTDVEAYTFSIINYTSGQESCQKQIGINLRMFKNKPQYIFEGALHEQVKPSILRANPEAKIIHSDLPILHYGYSLDNPNKTHKNLRNIEILQKVVAENPTDYFSHYNLGVSYYVNGQLEKAKHHFQLAKKHASGKDKYLPALFRNYAVCLLDLGLYEGGLNLLTEGIATYPDYPDLYYLQGQIYVCLKLDKDAQSCFNKCLQFTKINPNYISTKGVESFLAHEYLADIYFNQQQWQKAVEHQLQAIQAGAKSFNAALRLALFSGKKFTNPADIAQFLERHLNYLNSSQLLEVLFNAGCYQQVLKHLELLADLQPDTLLLAAKSCLYLKKGQDAQKYLLQIPEKSSNYQEAQILAFINTCLQNTDANPFMAKIALKDPELAQACQLITNLFKNRASHRLPTPNSSDQSVVTTHYINLIYQLVHYDFSQTIEVLKDKLPVPDFAYLCLEVGKLAFKSGNFYLTKKLLILALQNNHRQSTGYRLLGESLLHLGEVEEGFYFLKKAADREPDRAENYLSLLKYLVNSLEKYIRDILNIYPQLSVARHHLCALATFRTRLLAKEEIICK